MIHNGKPPKYGKHVKNNAGTRTKRYSQVSCKLRGYLEFYTKSFAILRIFFVLAKTVLTCFLTLIIRLFLIKVQSLGEGLC